MSNYRLLVGDVRRVLESLPERSVQLCMTSPPYWALRSYLPADHPDKALEMGSEPTPEAYIAGQVAVFRAVWRVLRDDGVLCLNLGSCYASRDIEPSQFQRDLSVRACGTDDTKLRDSGSFGCACSCLCGECQAALSHHTGNISQQRAQSTPLGETTTRDSEPEDSSSTTLGALPHGARGSTTHESLQQPPDECFHCASCGVSLSVMRSTLRDFPQSTPSRACTCGKCKRSETLDHRIVDISSSGLAYGNSILNLPKFKAKDLIPLPWLVALALVNDGWYLRQAMPWVRRSAMPESVTDRPASAVEYVFLLSKSARYYWDAEAVKAAATGSGGGAFGKVNLIEEARAAGQGARRYERPDYRETGRNFRNADLWFQSVKGPHGLCGVDDELVGLDVTAEPSSVDHFAAYPSRLVEPFVKACTSERGRCPSCGKAWERVVERTTSVFKDNNYNEGSGRRDRGTQFTGNEARTIGWQPGCDCPAHEPVPCTVLDPFSGTGTTGVVATRHGRNYIGIDLDDKCRRIAERRIAHALRPNTARTDDVGEAELFAGGGA